jgi:hypothetical protein
MNSQTSDELREFYEFLRAKLGNGVVDLSPEQVLDEWRDLHPDQEGLLESISAVRQALADMAAGDKGRSLDVVLAELRMRYRLPRS